MDARDEAESWHFPGTHASPNGELARGRTTDGCARDASGSKRRRARAVDRRRFGCVRKILNERISPRIGTKARAHREWVGNLTGDGAGVG